VIYSQWRPDIGGYDYYDAPGQSVGIGDDLPVPRLSGGTDIGIPSNEAGRSIPSGSTRVGSGPVARGLVAPMSRSGVLGASMSIGIGNIGMLALGIGIGWWIWKRNR